ncbi:MAG: ABC-F family ATP-binding cassette domain-containing protein [Dysgonamonadaceae bacterium]|jgi:ATP-binding cassette subfamily F protein 3|nr:ABC-F family ATP-binding cassette domain-containing protein [Dysgonamonadaceae bacterium]
MISVENLCVSFGGFHLFDNITFVVDKKDKIALTGKNGAGKSTLLKIFAGLQEPTSGRISIPKDLSRGYLPQQMNPVDVRTVWDEAASAFDHIHRMEAGMAQLSRELAERTDYETDDYHRLIDRMTALNEQFLLLGGVNYQAEIEKTLIGLGFRRRDFERPVNHFSGGWRMRIELAKLLLKKPDVLLLDEPTNHLDIESIQWLENFLATQANAVILVSHDRAFIDNVTRRTIEISLGKIYDYRVNYSTYVVLRRERREQQVRAYENQQKQIRDTEDFIERFRYKATKAVQVQSRIKQLEKIERVEIDNEDRAALRLKFPPAPRSGAYPVVMEEVAKSYGDHLVFEHVNLTINRGEKIAFVGKNGEGKSTLVKCILQQIPYTGKLQLGHHVNIGYFAQNQADLLDPKLSVFDTIDSVATGDARTKIRDILGAFMFGGEASDKKVGVLSGGERSRLAMIRLLLEPVNLLILDEPTNHLDMRSKEVLKEALEAFDGTVILVSHDREFLGGLVDKVYEFTNQQVKEHLGGIYEFLEKKKLDSLQALESGASTAAAHPQAAAVPPVAAAASSAASCSKHSYEARKEQARLQKKHEKNIADIEEKISAIETEIKQLEEQLSTPEGASNATLYTRHTDLQWQLLQAMEKWEKLHVVQ